MQSVPLSAIELKNFKCFREQRIDLGMLTVLSGLNGVGKSSVIQALLLLRQSLTGNRIQRRLRLSGDLVDLGTGADVLFDLADEDELAFVLEFGGARRSEYAYTYSREGDRLSLRSGRQRMSRSTRESYRNDDGEWLEVNSLNQSQNSFGLFRSFFSNKGFQYLAAERYGPRKSLPWSEEQVAMRSLGPQGEHVLAYLAEYGAQTLDEGDPRVRDRGITQTVEGQVSAWLQETSPGANLEISEMREIDALSARYSFRRSGDVASKPFRATNVGFGVSYALPVLTALIGAEPGDFVIIENPEAHLHPRGQTKMGELAARAAAAGVQVVIETHSDHFLDGVRLDIRRGKSISDTTKIHFFTRDGAESHVSSPKLQRDGSISDWPKGFFDEKDENLLGLLGPIDN